MAEVSQMTQDEIDEIITNNKIRLNTNDYKKLSKLFPRIKKEIQLSAILNETVGLFNKIDKWFQGTTMFTRAESNAMIYRYDCKKHSTNYSDIPSNVCRLFDMQQKQIHNILKAALSSHPKPPPLSFKEPILRCKIFLESIDSLKETNKKEEEEKQAATISQDLKQDEGLFKDLLDSIESAHSNAIDETFIKFNYKYKKLKDYFTTTQSFNNFLFGAITKDDHQTTRFDILFDTAQQKDRPDISNFLESKYQRSPSSSSPAAITASSSSPSTNFFSYFTTSRPTNNTDEILKSELDWHDSDGTRSNDNVSGDVTVTNGDGEEEEVRIAPGASSTSNTGLTKDPRSSEELTREFEANMNQARQEPSSNGNGSENADDGTSKVPKNKTVRSLFSNWSDRADKTNEKIKATPGAGENVNKETEDQTASLIGEKSGIFNRVKNAVKGTLKYARIIPSRENQTDTGSDTASEGKNKVEKSMNPLLQGSTGGKKTRKRRKPRKTRRKKQKKSKRKTKAKK
jgi:hypothetical protein